MALERSRELGESKLGSLGFQRLIYSRYSRAAYAILLAYDLTSLKRSQFHRQSLETRSIDRAGLTIDSLTGSPLCIFRLFGSTHYCVTYRIKQYFKHSYERVQYCSSNRIKYFSKLFSRTTPPMIPFINFNSLTALSVCIIRITISA